MSLILALALVSQAPKVEIGYLVSPGSLATVYTELPALYGVEVTREYDTKSAERMDQLFYAPANTEVDVLYVFPATKEFPKSFAKIEIHSGPFKERRGWVLETQLTGTPHGSRSAVAEKDRPSTVAKRQAASASGICGAPTREGGTCQRRVTGGGYCYQHR